MFVLPIAERLIRRRLQAIGIKSGYHPTRHGKIHFYEVSGEGDAPPLVILHGFGASASSFGRMLALLRRKLGKIWAPEAPAHGFSRARGRPTIDDVYDALAEFLSARLREPAVLFGNSLGGAFAIRYALERPEKVHALCLASPAGALLDAQDFAAMTGNFRIRSLAQAKGLLDRLYHEPPWYNALLAPDVMRRFSGGPLRHCLESARPEHMFTPEQLAELRPPTLLLWGRSERVLPGASLEYFRRALPRHVQFEEPDEFGHCPYLDRPAALSERLVRFIRSLD